MHTRDVVKSQNNKNKLCGAHWETEIILRLQVIFDAHPKKFIGVKLQQTVFLTGLDKYIGTVCIVKKGFK